MVVFHKLRFILLVVLAATACSGMFLLADYSGTAGPVSHVPDTLPESLRAEKQRAQRQLLLFYHPHCPCTVATARTLQRICSSVSAPFDLQAWAFHPESADTNWIETRTTQILREIPGCRVHPDRDGQTARSMRAYSSGHVLLYDSDFRLSFSGGITPGRGHEGDCDASDRLLTTLKTNTACKQSWPVWGCLIIQPDEDSHEF